MFYTYIGLRNSCISTLHGHQFYVDTHEIFKARTLQYVSIATAHTVLHLQV
jgi:hypothetical protein